MFHEKAQPRRARIGFGQTWHARDKPRPNRFQYDLMFLLLPMRSISAQASQCCALARNRFGLISFWDADHGLGAGDALAWAESVFDEYGVVNSDGEIWLQTLPRMLGYAFKPVSFWYSIRANGALAAVLVEVNNTFGERHCYMLNSPELAWGKEVQASKVFHVSPFFENRGEYTFKFTNLHEHIVATISLTSPSGAVLKTSWTGKTEVATSKNLRAAVFGSPLMTLMIVIKIHWQALKLFSKRIPFFRQPKAPKDFITK